MRPPNQSLEERVRQLTLMNNLYMAKFFGSSMFLVGSTS